MTAKEYLRQLSRKDARMHYDERWVRRLHGWALLRVEIPEDAKHARKSPF